MQNILKIVVTGPVGAGKTTFIRSISEIEVVDTDCKPTDETAELKENTTVAMDFGRITLGDDMWVQIYGTPGQQRFDFMWDLLIQGAHAYILLVPAHMPASIKEARHIKSFMAQRADIPFIIGVTHTDHEDAWDLDSVQCALGDFDGEDTYTLTNANDKASVAATLLELLPQIISSEEPSLVA